MTDEQKRKRKFLNRELPVLHFFCSSRFVFWYLNELSKELKGTIELPGEIH
ncbi:MAG: hypothetical protein U5L72_12780 [Bacteroidales bacterium]|nr:hypothetical protein [Bacteroidales bacterium]